ncbi:MAG: LuxR C-terminal-related transcriptional regulator [Aminobacteriaceae bacterium]
MTRPYESDAEAVYFPDHLLARLDGIKEHRLTLIEAPSGFGKTTSLREYLCGRPGARSFWYTCLGETQTKAWGGICDLVEKVDPDVSRSLRGLGMPDRDSAADAAAMMSECSCNRETFLVVDNYQLLQCDSPTGIVNAFSLHGGDSLRVVFITQRIPDDDTWRASNILKLNAGDYLFDRESVARFFRLSGLQPTSAELDSVHRASGGWIASIKLHMMHYRLTGTVAPESGMKGLIESALWERMTDRDKQLLMAVSLFDKFSLKQASMMLDDAPGEDKIAEILGNNVFIPYAPSEGFFYMHGILQEFLRKRFADTHGSFQAKTYGRAGSAARSAGDLFQATRFFLETRDYESILEMPFTTQFFYNFPERSVIDLFERLIEECPEETLLKHPMPLITFGQQFFRDRRIATFSRVTNLLQRLIDTPGSMPEEELLRVRGEFSILMSFPRFNDIAAMSEYHRSAYKDLERLSSPPRSQIFGGAMPWTMSGASVLFLYWRERGGLDRTLSVMDECLPYYVTLAGGHGAGGEFILRAESALARGDDATAEVMSRSAIYEAHAAGQTGNSLCAWLVLARAAILRGDPELYSAARSSIKEEGTVSGQRSILRIGDLCLAYMDLLLGRHDQIPPWLNRLESIRRAIYADGQPYALMLHGMALLQARRYEELHSLADSVLVVARRMNYLLPQVVIPLLLSAAKTLDGRISEAGELLKHALDLAMPDEMLMPFAEQSEALMPLMRSISGVYPERKMQALLNLCKRQTEGAEAIRLSLYDSPSLLSGRQREVALLLKDGLTIRQIAKRLEISENTVKSTVKAIYDRLGVHTRVELMKTNL